MIILLSSFVLSLHAQAQAPAETVTTREAQIVIDGTTYQHVQFDGKDYFLKSARPGSRLVEVSCRKPGTAGAETTFSASSRSRSFTDRLQTGCAPKTGAAPERFTFEQQPTNLKSPSENQDTPKTTRKVELLGPGNFPEGTDPHILPGQPPAGGNFDWNQRRY